MALSLDAYWNHLGGFKKKTFLGIKHYLISLGYNLDTEGFKSSQVEVNR